MTSVQHMAVGDDAQKLIARSLLKGRQTNAKHMAVGDDVLNLIVERLLEITAASV